ncbi:WEB family protein [Cardamine amara subsp. amara]|uniref:WEB family protein n=1 Tax=Cardamine amara subsp. amara TaxID=228776 RepID=A0ABD0ZB70_CARAN
MEREKGWRSCEAEIETRAVFGSVKEAVALFGEKILAGEIYGTRLKEIRRKETNSTPSPQSRLRSLTLELEQTKQTLTRTLQLNNILSNQIKTLTQELEHGRKEIQQLKRMRSCRLDNPEIDELKFAEQDVEQTRSKDVEQDVVTTEELETKRLVTFASSPLLTRVMSSVEDGEGRKKKEKVFERNCSVKKTKLTKGFAPIIGWFRATRGGD